MRLSINIMAANGKDALVRTNLTHTDTRRPKKKEKVIRMREPTQSETIFQERVYTMSSLRRF